MNAISSVCLTRFVKQPLCYIWFDDCVYCEIIRGSKTDSVGVCAIETGNLSFIQETCLSSKRFSVNKQQ
jgi:hypothetical protein